MKKIIKNKEPKKLVEYRNQFSKIEIQNEDLYNDFRYKDKEQCKIDENNLRKILLETQGYICCYCMSRINCDNSKIEHFKSQTKYRELQLDYKNLFIACKGGEGSKEHFCDTAKKDKELKKINLLENIENFIRYRKNLEYIEIYSDDIDIDSDLKILNLNANILKKNRKEKYDEVIKNLHQKNFDINFMKRTLEYFKKKDKNNKYPEFCEMVVFFLQKKLKGKQ